MSPRLIGLLLSASLAHASIAVAQPQSDRATAPDGGLRVAVFTATYLQSGPMASVLVGVEVEGISPQASAGAPRQLEVVVSPEPEASSKAAVMSIALSDRAAAARAVREGVRALSRISLPVGHHELRVSARDTGTQAVATIVHRIDVPDLNVGALSMSDLVITGSHVEGVSNVETDHDALMPLVGKPPTSRRQFSRDERVEVNAEIYEAPPSGQDDVFGGLRIATRILTAGGKLVSEAIDEGAAEPLPLGAFGYQHYALVPIGTLAPGQYVVQVSAWIDTGEGAVTRSLAIEVTDPRN